MPSPSREAKADSENLKRAAKGHRKITDHFSKKQKLCQNVVASPESSCSASKELYHISKETVTSSTVQEVSKNICAKEKEAAGPSQKPTIPSTLSVKDQENISSPAGYYFGCAVTEAAIN